MRILVLRDRGGWGDAVCCQAAVAGLREKYPDARIDWVLPAELHGLFTHDPTRPTLLLAPKKTREFTAHRVYNLADYGLTAVDYEHVVDLWCPAWRYESECGMDVRVSRIENFCDEAGVAPRRPALYPGEVELAWARKLISKKRRPFVLIAWASANAAKDYPTENWAAVARQLLERGASVTFVGTKLFPAGVTGADRLMCVPSGKLIALCAVADLVLTLDSGIGHIAAAIARPTLWLFGPTNPVSTLKFYPGAQWLAQCDTADARCEWPCYFSPARGFHCKNRPGDCLKTLSPWSVVRVAERMLDWPAAEADNRAAMRDDALYEHYRGLGTDYRAYGAWHAAYGEFLDHLFDLKGKRILDVGAACGTHVKCMVARGADAHGIEPNRFMATHGVSGIDGRLRHGYIEQLREPERYDVVHSHQVLEHVPEDAIPMHLASIYRALRPGGIVYANVCLGTSEGCTRDKTHITLKPYAWWIERALDVGFEDLTNEYRQRVEREPMQTLMRWDWFILHKPTQPRKEAKSA